MWHTFIEKGHLSVCHKMNFIHFWTHICCYTTKCWWGIDEISKIEHYINYQDYKKTCCSRKSTLDSIIFHKTALFVAFMFPSMWVSECDYITTQDSHTSRSFNCPFVLLGTTFLLVLFFPQTEDPGLFFLSLHHAMLGKIKDKQCCWKS